LRVCAQQVLQKLDTEVHCPSLLEVLESLEQESLLDVWNVLRALLQHFDETSEGKLLGLESRVLVLVLSNVPEDLAVEQLELAQFLLGLHILGS
jgi:hypothetical protein